MPSKKIDIGMVFRDKFGTHYQVTSLLHQFPSQMWIKVMTYSPNPHPHGMLTIAMEEKFMCRQELEQFDELEDMFLINKSW